MPPLGLDVRQQEQKLHKETAEISASFFTETAKNIRNQRYLCEITYRKNWAELKSKRANSQPREGEIRYTQGSPRDAELVELMRQHPSCPTMNTIQRHSLRLGSELPQPHNPDLKKILLINSHLTLRGTKIWNRD